MKQVFMKHGHRPTEGTLMAVVDVRLITPHCLGENFISDNPLKLRILGLRIDGRLMRVVTGIMCAASDNNQDANPLATELSPMVDRTHERIQLAAKLREGRLKERVRGLASLLDSAGWCACFIIEPQQPLWVGDAARQWLNSRVPRFDSSTASLALIKDQVPSDELLVSTAELLVWRSVQSLNQEAKASQLSLRETEILDWLQQGKTSPEIAIICGCSPRTVEKHVQNLYRKLGVHNRCELVLKQPTTHDES